MWARQDLNLRPIDYESTALTTELRARCAKKIRRRRLLRTLADGSSPHTEPESASGNSV